ncbi:uncharacterized protein GGS25DRAFT_495890, partial [Hypoxylon fragiforme]|uniref:uncharacterized protein n=1 Tax=Hypoxylon fragiforme TaxID=63214 RepID=UPI0020C5C24B
MYVWLRSQVRRYCTYVHTYIHNYVCLSVGCTYGIQWHFAAAAPLGFASRLEQVGKPKNLLQLGGFIFSPFSPFTFFFFFGLVLILYCV